MRAAAGIVGLLVVCAVGYFVFQSYLGPSGATSAPPQQQIDIVDIKSNLLVIGQAERQYLVAHGTYGTLEQLQQDGPPSLGTEQRGYVFAITADGAKSFTATATPTDPSKAGWPTLVVDETLQVTQR